jgi:hypothetical protein
VALVKKGSCAVVVDGDSYRWRVRHKPSYCQANGWTPQTFAVEDAATPGTTLVVRTGQPHTGNWLGLPTAPVLPADVAKAIQLAQLRAWAPTATGSPFILNLSDTTDNPSA